MVNNNFSAFGRSEKIDLLNVRKKERKNLSSLEFAASKHCKQN